MKEIKDSCQVKQGWKFFEKIKIRALKFMIFLLKCTLWPPNCTVGPPNLGVGGPRPLPSPPISASVINAFLYNINASIEVSPNTEVLQIAGFSTHCTKVND